VTGLLAVDGDDVLAAEAGSAVHQISAALPDGAMQRHFASADPVRMVVGLTAHLHTAGDLNT
jgi:hypothetical protein